MKAGWKTVKLREIGDHVKGSSMPDKGRRFESWSVPAFENGQPEVVEGSSILAAKTPVKIGDVLICKINPRINRVWRVSETGNNLPRICSTEWVVFRAKNPAQVIPEWVQIYCSSPAFREWITGQITGTTGSHARAKPANIFDQEIPLPPLAEQKRIVALLDETFVGIDEAKAKAEASMDLALETLNSFLEIEFNAGNSELSPIGEIFTTMTGTTPPKSEASYYGKDFLFVKPPELRGGLIVETEDGLTKEGAAFARIAPRNSILVSCIGILGKVGWADKPVAFNQQINAILPREDRAHWKYMLFQMKSPKFRKSLTEASTGTTVYMVNKSKFNQLMVRLPSLRHQATAAERFAEIDQLQNELTENQKKRKEALNSLKASLLTQAFAGELTA